MDAKVGNHRDRHPRGESRQRGGASINAPLRDRVSIKNGSVRGVGRCNLPPALFWERATLHALHDVADVDFRRGPHDSSVRPNQIFGGRRAAGASARLAAAAAGAAQRKPVGLTGPHASNLDHLDYHPHYRRRTTTTKPYHTMHRLAVLMGPFVEAKADSVNRHHNRAMARERFAAAAYRICTRPGWAILPEVIDVELYTLRVARFRFIFGENCLP